MSLIAFAFLLSSHLREAPALLSCSHVKRRDKKSGEKLPLLRGSSIILEDFDEAKAKIRAKGIILNHTAEKASFAHSRKSMTFEALCNLNYGTCICLC